MPVRKRKGSPYYWYDFTVKGRRFRGSTKEDSKAAAVLAEHGIREKVLKGDYVKTTVDVDGACGLYWEEHGYKARSSGTIEYQLSNITAALGHVDLHQLTARHVAEFRSKRVAQVSPASVNRELTLLRAVVNKAVNEWGYEGPRIVWKKLFLKEPPPRDFYLKRSQARKLVKAAHPELAEMIEFTLMTGVRKSNCLGLKWDQIDFGAGQITFRVKGGKTHVIPVTRKLMLFLANLPRRKGRVFNTVNFKRRWGQAKKKAGLRLRWHDLRHTAASWMIQDGVALDQVKEALGHSDISTTLRYAHRDSSAKKEAFRKLAAHYGHNRGRKKSKSLKEKKKSA